MGMVDIWQKWRTRKHGDTDKDNSGELEFDLKLSLSSSCTRALLALCIEQDWAKVGSRVTIVSSLPWNDRPTKEMSQTNGWK